MWPLARVNRDSLWARMSRSNSDSRRRHGSTSKAGCWIIYRRLYLGVLSSQSPFTYLLTSERLEILIEARIAGDLAGPQRTGSDLGPDPIDPEHVEQEISIEHPVLYQRSNRLSEKHHSAHGGVIGGICLGANRQRKYVVVGVLQFHFRAPAH